MGESDAGGVTVERVVNALASADSVLGLVLLYFERMLFSHRWQTNEVKCGIEGRESSVTRQKPQHPQSPCSQRLKACDRTFFMPLSWSDKIIGQRVSWRSIKHLLTRGHCVSCKRLKGDAFQQGWALRDALLQLLYLCQKCTLSMKVNISSYTDMFIDS